MVREVFMGLGFLFLIPHLPLVIFIAWSNSKVLAQYMREHPDSTFESAYATIFGRAG